MATIRSSGQYKQMVHSRIKQEIATVIAESAGATADATITNKTGYYLQRPIIDRKNDSNIRRCCW
jgi:hypothetical protein